MAAVPNLPSCPARGGVGEGIVPCEWQAGGHERVQIHLCEWRVHAHTNRGALCTRACVHLLLVQPSSKEAVAREWPAAQGLGTPVFMGSLETRWLSGLGC